MFILSFSPSLVNPSCTLALQRVRGVSFAGGVVGFGCARRSYAFRAPSIFFPRQRQNFCTGLPKQSVSLQTLWGRGPYPDCTPMSQAISSLSNKKYTVNQLSHIFFLIHTCGYDAKVIHTVCTCTNRQKILGCDKPICLYLYQIVTNLRGIY